MYKIAYVTSSRADYGIVRTYLEKLNDDNEIHLEILATGTILDEKYGNAYKTIENDGFNISNTIKVDCKSTDNSTIISNMSKILNEFGEIFAETKYDLVIILGDRYEMLSVAIAASMNKLKILHIHGGEATYANYDEFIRHSITKMSLYHFTSTEDYKRRVIQLGENPERVFNIGAMGCENCHKIDLDNVSDAVKALTIKEYFIVLFHPETLTEISLRDQTKILLDSISKYIIDYKFVFLGTNSDTGSDEIRKLFSEYIRNNENAIYFENLHPDSYHYLLKNSIALIGNSSSGIIEAPSLNCYTINIGDRQNGRVRGNSVLDVKCDFEEIVSKIEFVLNNIDDVEFDNPYYKENASENAYEITKEILKRNDKNNLKEFYDLR